MFSRSRTRALFAPCAAVALALGIATPAYAQSVAAPVPSASPISEIGRVTTSDRQDEPASAATRTTYVVTKAEMLLHGDDTVAAAISRVPGVLIQQYGAYGTTATVTIRGQRNDGILVLLDGRPIAGAQIGATDLGEMPTAGVERIEIVEGTGATLYGNGASAGVIDIITARTNAAYKTPVVSVAGGSYGYGKAALETANFSFSRERATNNYNVGPDPLITNPTRLNADASSTNARFTDAGTFGNLHVSGSAGFVSRIVGVPGQDSFLTNFARQQDDTQDARFSLSLVHPHATTTLDLSGMRETLTFLDPSFDEGGPELDFSTDARVQANLRNNVVSDSNRLIYGVDLAHGVARNDGSGPFSGPAYGVTPYAQTALYVQDSLALGADSRIYAGLRGERDGAAGGALSPTLGATIGFGDGFALKLNAGTAFRVPTAEDLAFPGFSNPLLQPERSQSFDATIAASHVLGGMSFGWFVQTATNLIEVNPNVDFGSAFGPGNEPVINQPQSSVGGFLFDVSSKSYNGIAMRLNVTDAYRALGYADGTVATRLPQRPVFSTSLDVGYTGPATATLAALGAVAHTVGALDTTGAAGNYTSVDAYVRLRVAQHALVSLRVYDLGNERYQEVSGYPMPGRTVTLELSTR